MTALSLSQWQFAMTTVYHFFFVPITIGTAFLVAGMQTAWLRTGNEKWLRATKFWGKLFLINFAMGVVTGIVQEFQFGMNWSDYSRFVGDIFGAPLAVEGLLAFFLESTFLGLWIFGWDRLPKKLHLATIWLAAIGSTLSAYFILAANSFMQHPVGYTMNPETMRAEMTNFGEVLFQELAIVTFAHVIATAFLVSGLFVAGTAAILLYRKQSLDVARAGIKLGGITAIVAFLAVGISGDKQGTVMVDLQPMKMAAAEALYETEAPAPFSILTIGTLDGSEPVFTLDLPHGLSLLATHTFDGQVQGINNLQAEYEQRFGPGDYKPNIPAAYWNFRMMIGFGGLGLLIALFLLWSTRKGKIPESKWFPRIAVVGIIAPLLGASTGWIFTEMGRQPWVVFSLMFTRQGVSPTSTVGMVLLSIIVFTVLYSILAVVEVGLLARAVRIGPPEITDFEYPEKIGEERPLTVTY